MHLDKLNHTTTRSNNVKFQPMKEKKPAFSGDTVSIGSSTKVSADNADPALLTNGNISGAAVLDGQIIIGKEAAAGVEAKAASDVQKQTQGQTLKAIPIMEEQKPTAHADSGKKKDFKHLIPDEKARLIHVESTVKNMARIGRSIKLDENVLMIGPTGAGKTAIVKYLAHLTKNPLRRINMSNNTDEAELIGDFKPDPESGRPVWVDGILTEAMKEGHWLLIDEMNLAPPEILAKLHSVLESDRFLMLERKNNEVVKAHPNFRVFATMNPMSYAGREEMNKAFMNRFKKTWIEGLSAQEMVEIVKKKSDLGDDTLLKMAMFHQSVADLAEHDKLGRRTGPYAFTLRDMMRWTKRINHYKQKHPKTPVEKIVWREAMNIYRDCFYEDKDRGLVEKNMKLAFGESAKPDPENNKKIVEKGGVVSIGDADLEVNPNGGQFVPDDKNRLVDVHSTVNVMEKMSKCLKFNEPVLLVGETAAGKTAKVKYLANLTNNNVRRFNLGDQTDTFDFIGGYKPTGVPGEYKWFDGILIDAMKKGDWIILDEINFAHPAILERINPLLDGESAIVLTEKGNERVEADPNFRLIATMNPPSSEYSGTNELSPAMRNRFNEIYDQGLQNDELGAIQKIFMKKVPNGDKMADKMVKFHVKVKDMLENREIAKRRKVENMEYTIRNLKSWAKYMKVFHEEDGEEKAFVGGAEHVYASEFPNAKDREKLINLATEYYKENK